MADFLIGSSTLRDGDTIRSFLVAGPQTIEPEGLASAVAFGQPEMILSRLVHRLRVMEAEFGRPGVYILRTVADYAGVYAPVSPGGPGLGYQADTIPLVGNTLLLLMDIPMLRDSDDNAGFYLALGIESGEPADWRGAVILRAIDNVEFEDFSSGTVSATYGYAKTALATTTRWASWDRTNTVSVRLRRGSLSNITPIAALNGGNAALLGDEIIHFTTATQTATDEYTLSELIRARRGTDFAVGTHKAGERFLLLEQAALLRPVFQLSDLNRTLYYKPVSIGGDLETARSYDFANTGVALKPYAGTRLRGARDGSNNLTITWERRSRVDGVWGLSRDTSLAEATASYEVEIWTTGFGTLKRTIAVATTSASYTAAQQTTDFGGPQAAVSTRIYQLSATVGRGFPVQAVL